MDSNNFGTFLGTVNLGKAARGDDEPGDAPDGATVAASALEARAKQVMAVLRQGELAVDQLAERVKMTPTELEPVLAYLRHTEMITSTNDSTIRLSEFASEALQYFNLA